MNILPHVQCHFTNSQKCLLFELGVTYHYKRQAFRFLFKDYKYHSWILTTKVYISSRFQAPLAHSILVFLLLTNSSPPKPGQRVEFLDGLSFSLHPKRLCFCRVNKYRDRFSSDARWYKRVEMNESSSFIDIDETANSTCIEYDGLLLTWKYFFYSEYQYL